MAVCHGPWGGPALPRPSTVCSAYMLKSELALSKRGRRSAHVPGGIQAYQCSRTFRPMSCAPIAMSLARHQPWPPKYRPRALPRPAPRGVERDPSRRWTCPHRPATAPRHARCALAPGHQANRVECRSAPKRGAAVVVSTRALLGRCALPPWSAGCPPARKAEGGTAAGAGVHSMHCLDCPEIGAADSEIDRGRRRQRPSGDGKQRSPVDERARPSARSRGREGCFRHTPRPPDDRVSHTHRWPPLARGATGC